MIEATLLYFLKFIVIAGYLGVFLLLLAEASVFPFLPSEVILLFAGILITLNQFNFILLAVVSTSGSLVGYMLVYEASRKQGVEKLKKYGKWIGIRDKELQKANKWFDKHGSASVFFARFMPGIRLLINIPAGTAQMPRLPFILFSFASTLIINVFFIGLGYYAGKNWESVSAIFGTTQNIIVGAVILTVAFVGWKMYKIRRK